MKGMLYVVSLLLSLPNLVVGLAVVFVRHTFATRSPLQIITDFFFGMVWGPLLATLLFVILLAAGFFSAIRAHAAMFAFVLNATALGFVLSSFGLPNDVDEALIFLPILLALTGFAWLAYRVFVPEPGTENAAMRLESSARDAELDG